ncbi:hypothetical protein DFH29DRAFT_562002 [Suillus ampliporus]|nr:hypothetical protein DFH29DRAFT_562002 [Suillus ampliporus]
MDPKQIVNSSSTINPDQVLDMGVDCTKVISIFRNIISPSLSPQTHRVSSPSHIATSLPVEILRVIMELTMPPPLHFLEPTIVSRATRFSRSCVLQTLRNLILVCRYWYDVGVSLLYYRVVILRSKQLFTLAHAVSNNHSLGEMIMSLHLECFVSVSQFATVSKAVGSILAATPNITQIALVPILKGQPALSLVLPRLAALAQNTSQTTDLHLRINHVLKCTLNLMPAFTYLTTFHIDMILGDRDELPTEILHLAFLEELQISWNPLHDAKFISALAEIFSLPSLRRLLLTSESLNYGISVEPLLRKFGDRLHFISLVRPYMNNHFWYNGYRQLSLAPLLAMCPNLTHLAMDTRTPIRMPVHACLTWVDCWVPGQMLELSEQTAITLIPHEERDKLPSLRGVRVLDMSLLSFVGVRTPLLIPPDTVRRTESIVWSYPSLDLRHDPGLVYRHKIDDVLAESLEQRL